MNILTFHDLKFLAYLTKALYSYIYNEWVCPYYISKIKYNVLPKKCFVIFFYFACNIFKYMYLKLSGIARTLKKLRKSKGDYYIKL